jgi:epoxyqueuosine reductase
MATEDDPMSLNHSIEELLKDNGAIKVGFANKETLRAGPPSTDLDYVFRSAGIDEEARSAVSFALPLDQDAIRLFIAKKSRIPHAEDNRRTLAKSVRLSNEVAELLRENGYEALGTAANLNHREELPLWHRFLPPDISHRYIAVASGVASFGWSGNVGLPGYGSTIILGTTVASAELEPTDPIPAENSFCEWAKSGGRVDCKLCAESCVVEMFDKQNAEYVTLGSNTYAYSRRRNTSRCVFGCGGNTGLHPSGKWSTWSPGRYKIPEDPIKLNKELKRSTRQREEHPLNPITNIASCGMCQLICFGDKKENAKNFKLLSKSGCAVQEPDGSLVILSAEEAEEKLSKMPQEHSALYS